jgi:hypothetical protein
MGKIKTDMALKNDELKEISLSFEWLGSDEQQRILHLEDQEEIFKEGAKRGWLLAREYYTGMI